MKTYPLAFAVLLLAGCANLKVDYAARDAQLAEALQTYKGHSMADFQRDMPTLVAVDRYDTAQGRVFRFRHNERMWVQPGSYGAPTTARTVFCQIDVAAASRDSNGTADSWIIADVRHSGVCDDLKVRP